MCVALSEQKEPDNQKALFEEQLQALAQQLKEKEEEKQAIAQQLQEEREQRQEIEEKQKQQEEKVSELDAKQVGVLAKTLSCHWTLNRIWGVL